tara:strand:+ start:3567 stop:5162 length:1596 start_codon:yes stop_codon:yes gene_type:complete
MARNALYTGIALTKDLETDTSGEDALLDASKTLAAQRAKDKEEKAKAKQQTEKDVLKNMTMDSKLVMPYHQRKFAEKMNEEMAGIVEAAKTGEGNLAVIGHEAKQRMYNYVGGLKSADTAMLETIDKIKEDEFSYAQDKQTIGGVEYNSIIEALSDPYADTPAGMAEIEAKYGGTEYNFQKNDPNSVALGMPEGIVSYNPQKMANPYDFADGLIDDDMYINRVDGRERKEHGRTWRDSGYQLSEGNLSTIKEETLNNKEVLRHYEEEIYREQKTANPELTRAEFSQTDWMDEIPDRVEEDAIKPLRNRLHNPKSTETTARAPKTPAKTTFETYYDLPNKATEQIFTVVTADPSGGVDKEVEATFRRASLPMRKSPKYQSYTASKGGMLAEAGEGKMYNADRRTLEVASSGMASMGGQSFLVFDVKGGGELFEPAANHPFQEWVDRSGISRENAFDVARLAHNSSDLGIISDFIKEMTNEGITPDKKGDPKDKSKTLTGTKTQLEAAAKSKGMSLAEYQTDLESKGYTVIIK